MIHTLPIVKMGVYRHYKGGLYLVTGLARDEDNSDGRYCVIYHPLIIKEYGPCMSVRSIDEFTGWVEITEEEYQDVLRINEAHKNDLLPDIHIGSKGFNNEAYRVAIRFTYLGPIFWPSMA